jgi:hypothetical protein
VFVNIFSLLKSLLKLRSTGLSNAAPIANSVSMSSSTPTISLLKIQRNPNLQTQDGTFGQMTVDGVSVCETVENLGKEIAEGLYDAVIDVSPRLGYLCPHITVPLRDQAAGGDAGIRIHKLNEPCQSEGCIGPGMKKDGDAEDNSKEAFDKMMSLLPPPGVKFKVLVYSAH